MPCVACMYVVSTRDGMGNANDLGAPRTQPTHVMHNAQVARDNSHAPRMHKQASVPFTAVCLVVCDAELPPWTPPAMPGRTHGQSSTN